MKSYALARRVLEGEVLAPRGALLDSIKIELKVHYPDRLRELEAAVRESLKRCPSVARRVFPFERMETGEVIDGSVLPENRQPDLT